MARRAVADNAGQVHAVSPRGASDHDRVEGKVGVAVSFVADGHNDFVYSERGVGELGSS